MTWIGDALQPRRCSGGNRRGKLHSRQDGSRLRFGQRLPRVRPRLDLRLAPGVPPPTRRARTARARLDCAEERQRHDHLLQPHSPVEAAGLLAVVRTDPGEAVNGPTRHSSPAELYGAIDGRPAEPLALAPARDLPLDGQERRVPVIGRDDDQASGTDRRIHGVDEATPDRTRLPPRERGRLLAAQRVVDSVEDRRHQGVLRRPKGSDERLASVTQLALEEQAPGEALERSARGEGLVVRLGVGGLQLSVVQRRVLGDGACEQGAAAAVGHGRRYRPGRAEARQSVEFGQPDVVLGQSGTDQPHVLVEALAQFQHARHVGPIENDEEERAACREHRGQKRARHLVQCQPARRVLREGGRRPLLGQPDREGLVQPVPDVEVATQDLVAGRA